MMMLLVGDNMRGTTRLCLLTVLMILGSTVAYGETIDRIVATVNGGIILNSELQTRIRTVQRLTRGNEIDSADLERRAELERTVLQQMIRERLTEVEIKRLKISVGERELDEAIAQIKKENNFSDAQLDYFVQQDGLTMAQFKDNIRKELERARLLDRLLKSKTVITESQVDAFLKTGKAESADLRHIAIIFIPNAEGSSGAGNGGAEKLAGDIHRRLKEGADFGKLAREYSKGPAAEEGGDIGFINSDELAPAIAAATRGMKPNDITDPLKSSTGVYIIKLIDVQKEKVNTADAAVREKARRQLFQQEVNRKFEEWIKDLEARAFIQVSL
jgi:peptidyl-prolyl cis-trans isomerase SurA